MADRQNRQRRWWRRVKPTHPVAAVQAIEALEAKIKPDFKVAVGAGAIALGCLVVGVDLGGVNRHGQLRWLVIGLTIGFVVLGALAVRSAGRELNRIAKVRAGIPAASALRTLAL